MSEITEDLALTAMCVWEHLLSITADDDADNAYVKIHREIGASGLRSFALNTIAPAVEAAYKSVSEKYHEPFDWEFVPAFLARAEPIFAKAPCAFTPDKAAEIGESIVIDLAAIYKLDIERELRKPTIIEAKIIPVPIGRLDVISMVLVKFDDGTEKELFSFYPDEISFDGAEFIGLNELEAAHALRHVNDLHSLQR